MWTQSSFGMGFVRVYFGNARWGHTWVNQRGLCSRNKILPRSAQILFVVGTAFAMHVNARSSNHDPNHLAVRRSCSWLGRHLQCMWMHVVQITIPITKRIVIRNVSRNLICSFVNTAKVYNVFYHICYSVFKTIYSFKLVCLEICFSSLCMKSTIWIFECQFLFLLQCKFQREWNVQFCLYMYKYDWVHFHFHLWSCSGCLKYYDMGMNRILTLKYYEAQFRTCIHIEMWGYRKCGGGGGCGGGYSPWNWLGVCCWRFSNRTHDFTISYPVFLVKMVNLGPISIPKLLKFGKNRHFATINIYKNIPSFV